MYRDNIRSASGKISHIADRLLHHEMYVKNDVRIFSQRGHHAHSKGDGWHKHAVHNIDMQILRSGLLYQIDLFSQLRAVRRQDGWRQYVHITSFSAAVRRLLFCEKYAP